MPDAHLDYLAWLVRSWAFLAAFTGAARSVGSSQQLEQVVRRHVRAVKNPGDEPRLERMRTMNRNRCSASVWVTHDVMRPLNVLKLESGTLKRAGHQFSAAGDWELGGHYAASSIVMSSRRASASDEGISSHSIRRT